MENHFFIYGQEVKKLLDLHFSQYTLSQIRGGATASNIWKLSTPTQRNFILKASPVGNPYNSLIHDQFNFTFLANKIPVPTVIFFEHFHKKELLCTTAIPGKTLEYSMEKIPHPEIVHLYASTLKKLHTLPLDTSAPIRTVDEKLEAARYNIEHQLVNLADLEPENQGIPIKELYEELLSLRPNDTELVFTHGDYSLDNIMINKGQLSGLIDMGRGGVADLYQDIAIAVRSIKTFLGENCIDKFLRIYGLQKLDERKMRFYTLLDEFF